MLKSKELSTFFFRRKFILNNNFKNIFFVFDIYFYLLLLYSNVKIN